MQYSLLDTSEENLYRILVCFPLSVLLCITSWIGFPGNQNKMGLDNTLKTFTCCHFVHVVEYLQEKPLNI